MHTSARAHALRTSAVTYPGSIEHVSTVRANLRALLRDCPVSDDVILCASELTANAALRSHSRLSGGTFTVRVTIIPSCHVRRPVEPCPDGAGVGVTLNAPAVGLGRRKALSRPWSSGAGMDSPLRTL